MQVGRVVDSLKANGDMLQNVVIGFSSECVLHARWMAGIRMALPTTERLV